MGACSILLGRCVAAAAVILGVSFAGETAPHEDVKDTASTSTRTVYRVAPGIYTIRHPDAPDQFPQGNTTVIVGKRAVLVVDAPYLPSAAREDIAQIRTWTKKPVRYLLNTHWHFDHTQGNGEYLKAFPGLAILAHAETRKQMAGYNPGWLYRYPRRTDGFRATLSAHKEADGTPLTEARIKELTDTVRARDAVWRELSGLRIPLPTRTFERSLEIDLGDRAVSIRHLGRGNTAGDAVAFLPTERIVVAGDLLDHPIPYLGGGYPSDEVKTLERMAALRPAWIVPGHGEPLRGTAYLEQVKQLISLVIREVGRQVYYLGNSSQNYERVLAAVMKAIPYEEWVRRFAGSNADNREFFETFSFPGLVKAVYAEAWRR